MGISDQEKIMMEARSTSEMSVNLCQTTWCNNLEHSHHQSHEKFAFFIYIVCIFILGVTGYISCRYFLK
jgi:hypothetical protein